MPESDDEKLEKKIKEELKREAIRKTGIISKKKQEESLRKIQKKIDQKKKK